jgi:hypothetical protein
MGYPVQNFPPTLSTSSAAFTGKANAFFAYTPVRPHFIATWAQTYTLEILSTTVESARP